ncbi:hypothetical protein N7450_005501 [Penicillium hetheringtonii]|uniref:Uncharacterized protein n=1 Tax=Penicillium hetheringtonii TaxID=911720 RepID=A0AAD6GS07_9EURO|nr:hypothetical protein N7450_005501 [Penicillium hetheringtonii]
MANILLAARVD